MVNPGRARAHRKRRRSRSRRRSTLLSANPPRRRRRRGRRRYSGLVVRSRLRRNPSNGGGSMRLSDATAEIMPAVVGAAGAMGLSYALQYLPLPSSMQTGVTAYAVQFGGSMAMGLAVGAVAGKKTGMAVALGGMTIVAFSLISDLVSGNLTSSTSSGSMSRFVPPGQPINRNLRGLGYQGPARIVGFPAQRGTTGFPVARQNVSRFVPAARG